MVVWTAAAAVEEVKHLQILESTLKAESIDFCNKTQFSLHHQYVSIYCQQIIARKGKERERECKGF